LSLLRGARCWHRFRIYPNDDRQHYYTVFVFDERYQMHVFHQKQIDVIQAQEPSVSALAETNLFGDFEAITSAWRVEAVDVSRQPASDLNLGQILFYKKRLGAGIVSHEMTHAAFFWMERRGMLAALATDADVQEQCCLVQGNLTQQFWVKWLRIEKRSQV
jgi:hypothetical protein